MAPAIVAPSSGEAQGAGPSEPRRVRTSKPKVKTGCKNCKQRRIKCDEKRPACTQCVRSKKECSGYPPPPRAIAREVRIAPRPEAASSAPVAIGPAPPKIIARRAAPDNSRLTPPQTPARHPIQPWKGPSPTIHRPSAFSFDPIDGQYFQLFREHTASELSGFFDSSFWSCSVLQTCHSEEAVRHSVVALGALYKTLEKICESPPGSPSDFNSSPVDYAKRHWETAFKHYAHALSLMRQADAQDPGTQRSSLMATVLLACFDSFIGDHKQAIFQIQNGLRLLEELRVRRRRAFLPRAEEPVEQDLIQMFTRLAIQAKSYDMAFHFPEPYVIRLTPQQGGNPDSPSSDGGSPVSTFPVNMPAHFSSLLEARLAWDALCEKFFRFAEILFMQRQSGAPKGLLPENLQQKGAGFVQQIQAWVKAFEPILTSRNAPGKSSQEKTGIAVLKMNMIMGRILFMMTFKDNEQHFDEFLDQFQFIVMLASEVVGDEERRAAAKRCPNPYACQHQTHADILGDDDYTAKHIKPSFSADLGIVPPLFVVATKCRDPIVRRRAIQLLMSSSRREGMWDSTLTARIGLWVATIEEEDSGLYGRPSFSSAGKPDLDSLLAGASSTGSPGAMSMGSADFSADSPLGPGGNARWDRRSPDDASLPMHLRHDQSAIPADKRVMIQSVQFDLRKRSAQLECGTRGLKAGMTDFRTRTKDLRW